MRANVAVAFAAAGARCLVIPAGFAHSAVGGWVTACAFGGAALCVGWLYLTFWLG